MQSRLEVLSNGVKVEFLSNKIDAIKSIVEELKIVDSSIKNIAVGLIVNSRFNSLKKDYDSGKFEVFDYNFPKNINGKQYNNINDVKLKIYEFLQMNKKEILQNGVETISIMFLYNNEFKNLKIKGVKMNTQTQNNINILAVKPKFSLEQVVLVDELKNEMKKTLTIVQKQELIYNTWGSSGQQALFSLLLH